MAYFPLYVDLNRRPCLVAGGGGVACGKIRTLLSFGASVKVVAPEVTDEIRNLPVEVSQRRVTAEDIDGMALVVDATGDQTVGEMLSAFCLEKNTPFNAVDNPSICSFIFPAICQRGNMTAAVSTGGTSPTAAAWLRDRIAEVVPPHFDEVLEQMETLRTWAKENIPERSVRAALLQNCFSAAISYDRPLTAKELSDIRSQY